MRSHTDAGRRRFAVASAVALALVMTWSLGAASIQAESARTETRSEGPTAAEIEHAIEVVRADPNLTPERTIKTLRWKKRNESRPLGLEWLEWIADLFGWIGQSARNLMWVAIGLLAAWLLVYLVRMARGRGQMPMFEEPFVAPTHVRDMDIRPESLPPDIGRAARGLWDAGDRRAALALLYRGLLSRLTHVHRVPIRDSSTEGDCLTLTASHLTARRHEYSTRLVRVWQRFVYGGEDVPAATVHVLCDDFAATLDRAAAPGSANGGAI